MLHWNCSLWVILLCFFPHRIAGCSSNITFKDSQHYRCSLSGQLGVALCITSKGEWVKSYVIVYYHQIGSHIEPAGKEKMRMIKRHAWAWLYRWKEGRTYVGRTGTNAARLKRTEKAKFKIWCICMRMVDLSMNRYKRQETVYQLKKSYHHLERAMHQHHILNEEYSTCTEWVSSAI